jgi:PAS domain S-box-containing protein
LFRSLYENASIGIFRMTPDGRILMANPALVKMLGFGSFEELARWDTDSLYPAGESSRVELLDAIERKDVRGAETRLAKKDGTPVEIRVNGTAIRDSCGRTLYYDGTIEDVTDRKRMESALDQERTLVRAFMDHIPDHIYFKDVESRFTLISRSQAARHGLADPAMAVGRTDFDFFSEEHARAAFEDEKRILRTGEPLVGVEEKETWPDGSETWVSTTKVPLMDGGGRIIGTFGVSRDITGRKRAEEERNLWIEAFTNAEWGIVIADPKTRRLKTANPAFARMHGYSMRELEGKPVIDLFAPASRDGMSEYLSRAAREGRVTYESVHLRRDGSTFPVQVDVTVTLDAAGVPSSAVINVADITDRKKMEDVIRADLQEKRTLLKEIHHRVKNNMQVIISLLNLQSVNIDDPRLQALFAESQNRIFSMALVHEMLYGSDNLARIDMSAYLNRLIPQLRNVYGRHAPSAVIETDLAPCELGIELAVPFGLLVHEIISNSFKHAFPEAWTGSPRVDVRLQSLENKILLSISDNGIGLPANETASGRTNLGMTLIYLLGREQLQGEVNRDSDGSGTRYTVRFATD